MLRRRVRSAGNAFAGATIALALALALCGTLAGPGEAAATPPAAAVAFVPELGLPGTEVVAIGASPGEAPGEAWAYGHLGAVPPGEAPDQVDRYTLLEHTTADGWQSVALPRVGWRPDAVSENGEPSGIPQNLRGVAWPTTEIAYAVGEEGAIWVWQPGSARAGDAWQRRTRRASLHRRSGRPPGTHPGSRLKALIRKQLE